MGEGEIDDLRGARQASYIRESQRRGVNYLAVHAAPTDKLLIVCDDINLPPGKLRIRRRGSAAGTTHQVGH